MNVLGISGLDNIAGALQAVLQTAVMHVLQYFKKETGQSHLCMAGGVALNCSLNGVLNRSRMFRSMFVQPAAGDDGTALGAALYVQGAHEPAGKMRRMSVPLWGPEFKEEVTSALLAGRSDCHAESFCSFAELLQKLARNLAQGQIIGWFQGRMEFGPRALGSRSILADGTTRSSRHGQPTYCG